MEKMQKGKTLLKTSIKKKEIIKSIESTLLGKDRGGKNQTIGA